MLSKPQSRSLRMLLLPALTAALSACSSMPTFVATPPPSTPPLPKEARQPETPSLCSPSCLEGLMRERKTWRESLTSAALPASPASGPMAR